MRRRRDKENQGKSREGSTKAQDRPAEAQACCGQSDSSKASASSQAFLLECDFLTESRCQILSKKNSQETKSNIEIKASVSSKEPQRGFAKRMQDRSEIGLKVLKKKKKKQC